MVSQLLREHPAVVARVVSMPMASLCLSAITEGKLLFGLAKRPAAKQLHRAVHELLLRVEVKAWDSAAAQCYGPTRATIAQQGRTLPPLDLLIISHALSIDAVLVTNDPAIRQMAPHQTEDWTQ